ncbi:SH3 domain-containing protein [Salinarimonas ramus]|nr:SH3 domain-containing protein [Salinarimonas ramus]
MAAFALFLASVLVPGVAYAVPVATTTQLNLRAGPGVGSPVVAVMPPGEVVELRGCQGTWCFVVYRGRLGWASGRYLVRIPFRAQPRGGLPLLDWLAPRAEPPTARLAPPPPGTALPRVIEPPATPAPEPRRERRVRRPSPAPTPERGAPPRDGGVLRDAAPTITVPRPDASPPEPETSPGTAAPRSTPRASDETQETTGESGGEPRRRLHRGNATTGGSGSDVL